jgi:hypothetical protein
VTAVGSSYVSIGDGGPDAIISTALQVKSAGDDFAGKAQALAQAIRDIEHGNPWGDGDKYAQAFLKNYTASQGGSKPANQAVVDSLADSGTSMSKIGLTVVETMAKYAATDTDGATSIDGLAGGA